jgi:hypothetical protein
LNLEGLPEDSPSSKVVLRKREDVERPSTPVKTFLAKDTSVLPPTPSPKKTPVAERTEATTTPVTPFRATKTPSKPVKQVMRESKLVATQGPKIVRPASPLRHTVTQVKEFTFATDARSRRETVSPQKTWVESPVKQRTVKPSASTYSLKASSQKQATVDVDVDGGGVGGGVGGDVEVDDGVQARTKAHEIGKASILAWGETRGRYLDD